jgi:hypothetical protein
MARKLILILLAVVIAACTGATQTTTGDGTTGITVAKVGKKGRTGHPLWRKACYRIAHPLTYKKGDPIDVDELVGEGVDPDVETCVKGFMAMEAENADDGANCALDAEDQEAIFQCLQIYGSTLP